MNVVIWRENEWKIFLQRLSWFFLQLLIEYKKKGVCSCCFSRIFYLLTSVYRPECVNHVSLVILFFDRLKTAFLESILLFRTHPSSFWQKNVLKITVNFTDPDLSALFYFYQTNIFFFVFAFYSEPKCAFLDLFVLDRSRREVSNSKLNQKRTLTLFRTILQPQSKEKQTLKGHKNIREIVVVAKHTFCHKLRIFKNTHSSYFSQKSCKKS